MKKLISLFLVLTMLLSVNLSNVSSSVLAEDALLVTKVGYTTQYDFKAMSLDEITQSCSVSVRKPTNQEVYGVKPDVSLDESGMTVSYQLLKQAEADSSKAEFKSENEGKFFVAFNLNEIVSKGDFEDVVHLHYEIKKNPEDCVEFVHSDSNASFYSMIQHNQNETTQPWSYVNKVISSQYVAAYSPEKLGFARPGAEDTITIDIFVDRRENGLSRLFVNNNEFTSYYDDPARDDDGTGKGVYISDYDVRDYTKVRFTVTPSLAYFENNEYDGHETKITIANLSVTSVFDDIEDEIENLKNIADEKIKAEKAKNIHTKALYYINNGFSSNLIENYSSLESILNNTQYIVTDELYTISYDFSNSNSISDRNVRVFKKVSSTSVNDDVLSAEFDNSEKALNASCQLLVSGASQGTAKLAGDETRIRVQFPFKDNTVVTDEFLHIKYTVKKNAEDSVMLCMGKNDGNQVNLLRHESADSDKNWLNLTSKNDDVTEYLSATQKNYKAGEFIPGTDDYVTVDIYVDQQTGKFRAFYNEKEFYYKSGYEYAYNPMIIDLHGINCVFFDIVPKAEYFDGTENKTYDGHETKLLIKDFSVTSGFDDLENEIEKLVDITDKEAQKTKAKSIGLKIGEIEKLGIPIEKITNYSIVKEILREDSFKDLKVSNTHLTFTCIDTQDAVQNGVFIKDKDGNNLDCNITVYGVTVTVYPKEKFNKDEKYTLVVNSGVGGLKSEYRKVFPDDIVLETIEYPQYSLSQIAGKFEINNSSNEVKKLKLIAAGYDSNNNLSSINILDTVDYILPKDNQEIEYSFDRKDTKTLKIMAWNGFEGLKPYNMLSYSEKAGVINIYVATDGNDETGDGSYSNPFRTSEKAQTFAMSLKEQLRPINIIFKEGTYKITEPIVIGAKDSGNTYASVTFKGEDGKKVVFSGATRLSSDKFSLVTDEAVLNRLYPEVRNKIYQVDLAQFGITREQIDWTRYYDGPREIPGTEYVKNMSSVFVNNRKQTLSRWPNSGYVEINNYYSGSTSYDDTDYGRIGFDTDEPLRWTDAKDIFIGGQFRYEWYNDLAPVKGIDTQTKEILLGRENQYGISNKSVQGYNCNWTAYNLLEEIDVPGEYYIDHDTMKMYIYLAHKPTSADVIEISTYNDSFIAVENLENLTIKNITFEKSAGKYRASGVSTINQGAGIEIRGLARNINIEDCDFYYIGGRGIVSTTDYNYGNVLIDSCDFYDTAMEAIYIGGGDLETLTPFNGRVSNCMFYNSFIKGIRGTYSCVNFENNLFADIPGYAMRGNSDYGEYSVKYNEFSHCTTQNSDLSNFYIGRNAVGGWGTEISYNLFHHFGREDEHGSNAAAIYLDDGQGGTTCTHNIMYAKTNKTKNVGYMLSQGPDTKVYGNTVVNAYKGIHDGNREFSSTYISAINAAKENALKYQTFLDKYPRTKEYEALYETVDTYKSNNTITKNLVTDCTIPFDKVNHNVKPIPTGIYDEPVTKDYDIYVAPDKMDFRVSYEGKSSNSDIPSDVLTEAFDINLIGLQRPLNKDDDLISFNILSPLSEDDYMYYDRINIAWERSQFGSEYEYEIATDKDFNNISVKGKTFNTSITIDTLSPSTEYWLRVKAISYMRNDGYVKYNQNGVVKFTTPQASKN